MKILNQKSLNIIFFGRVSNNWQNALLGSKVYKALKSS